VAPAGSGGAGAEQGEAAVAEEEEAGRSQKDPFAI
jgi:hypothetical protein